LINKLFYLNIGGLAIAVPGALKGYSSIYSLYGGGVSWELLFEPMIRLCEEGIEVNQRLEINLKSSEKKILNNKILRYSIIQFFIHIFFIWPFHLW
jgi:gamma-glutamyltranspeptidase/glutathione hydrolase/leukotriene-C4 hydrolase